MSIQHVHHLLAAVLTLTCFGPSADGCTTFVLQGDGRLVFGRNLDWHVGEGLLIANPRNVHKRGLVLPMSPRHTNPAHWMSKYGSVTFNSLGRDFPTGGMNEAGLVIDIMWLNSTRYPAPDERPELHVLQWTQYLLDTCRSVDEVLASDQQVRISTDSVIPQHFLVSDAEGRVITIEFLDGKRIVHQGDSLPYPCLTNDTYEESRQRAALYHHSGESLPAPEGAGSLERFTRTSRQLAAYPGTDRDIVDYAFDMLHEVNQGYDLDSHSTVWSVVYDIAQKKIHFRTHNHRELRSLDLSRLKFDCQQPVPVWDVLAGASGDITEYSTPFTPELNRQTARKNVTHPSIVMIFGDMSPLLAPVSTYAESFTRCEP